MKEFNPPSHPRALVLGLFERAGRILVFEGRDPRRGLTFYRPIGGGIEFGEHSQAALVREVEEELGLAAEVGLLVGVLENIFEHQGKQGHEIVFVYHASFTDVAAYAGPVPFTDRPDSHAVWVPLADFLSGARTLFPDGLTTLLS